jgi:hypothetical protein
MTTFSGFAGIESNLINFVVSISLSSKRAVLIHQFDDGHGIVQPAVLSVPLPHTTCPGHGSMPAKRHHAHSTRKWFRGFG